MRQQSTCRVIPKWRKHSSMAFGDSTRVTGKAATGPSTCCTAHAALTPPRTAGWRGKGNGASLSKSRLSIHDQGIDYFTLEQLTPMIPAAFREPLRSSRPTDLAVPAQKSIRSRNLFAGNAARPGFSARAGPHRYSLAQAILPIGLPAAGGRRIGRWTCRRAAQPAGRAYAGCRPRRLIGLEVFRLL